MRSWKIHYGDIQQRVSYSCMLLYYVAERLLVMNALQVEAVIHRRVTMNRCRFLVFDIRYHQLHDMLTQLQVHKC